MRRWRSTARLRCSGAAMAVGVGTSAPVSWRRGPQPSRCRSCAGRMRRRSSGLRARGRWLLARGLLVTATRRVRPARGGDVDHDGLPTGLDVGRHGDRREAMNCSACHGTALLVTIFRRSRSPPAGHDCGADNLTARSRRPRRSRRRAATISESGVSLVRPQPPGAAASSNEGQQTDWVGSLFGELALAVIAGAVVWWWRKRHAGLLRALTSAEVSVRPIMGARSLVALRVNPTKNRLYARDAVDEVSAMSSDAGVGAERRAGPGPTTRSTGRTRRRGKAAVDVGGQQCSSCATRWTSC